MLFVHKWILGLLKVHKIAYFHFDLLISRIPVMVKKSFCTSDRAMNLTFQMNYVPSFEHICSKKRQKLQRNFSDVFFGTLFIY